MKKFTTRLVGQLNSLTGWTHVETMKSGVRSAEIAYRCARDGCSSSRLRYASHVQQRVNCQREITALLQRKHLWTDDDVSRFTQLFAQEHALDSSEKQLKAELDCAERAVEDSHDRLMDSIRERYQCEHVWSEKIRAISAYGTFALMAINISMFLLVHGYFEPRRRTALVEDVGRSQQASERAITSAIAQWKMEQDLQSGKLSRLLDTARKPVSINNESTVVVPEIKPSTWLDSVQQYAIVSAAGGIIGGLCALFFY